MNMSDKLLDVVVDLETLDTRPSAMILSIGAIRCNLRTGEMGDTFYENIDNHIEIQSSRTTDANTINWWRKQDQEVKEALSVDRKRLDVVLQSFRVWLGKGVKIWGNGASFDLGILRHAYDNNTPWAFYNERDARTLEALAKGIVNRDSIPRYGQHHHALDDARYEAKYLSAMWQGIFSANK